jgi:peptidoglycan/xylan/chitin deacetylase (PgdA/CDA1 family)
MRFIIVKLKTAKLFFIVAIVTVLLSINIGGGTAAAVYFGIPPRKVPVYCVETTNKQVAITFDSAWGADKTLEILKILKDYEAGATFFLVGFWVDKYPDMVSAIDEYGIEIGSHSNTHPDFVTLNDYEMKLEIETSCNLIKNITKKDVKLFRAPYGSYNNTLIGVTDTLKMTAIQWDVDTLDWQGISAMDIVNRVINNVKNGSIILCHNNSDHILDALPIMLDRLKLLGYKLTSVGDLLIKGNCYVDNLGVQRIAR